MLHCDVYDLHCIESALLNILNNRFITEYTSRTTNLQSGPMMNRKQRRLEAVVEAVQIVDDAAQ